MKYRNLAVISEDLDLLKIVAEREHRSMSKQVSFMIHDALSEQIAAAMERNESSK